MVVTVTTSKSGRRKLTAGDERFRVSYYGGTPTTPESWYLSLFKANDALTRIDLSLLIADIQAAFVQLNSETGQ